MKRVRIAVFALIVAVFGLSFAYADPTVSAYLDGGGYDAGDLIAVRVEIEDNPGLDGLFFDLSFPGDHLSFEGISHTNGSLHYAHSDYLGGSAARDHVVVSLFDEGATDNGPLLWRDGLLVELRFRVVQPGEAGEYFYFRFHDHELIGTDDGESIVGQWNDSRYFELGAPASGDAYIVIANPTNGSAVHSDTVAVDAVHTADAAYSVRLSNRTSGYVDQLRDGTAGVIEGALIPVIDGPNTIEAKLFDEYGALAALDTVTVVRAAEDEFVRITSPVDRALVNTDMVEVYALSPFEGITINGQPTEEIAVHDTGEREVFARVWLSEGFNTVRAQVEDEGAVYEDAIEVYYYRDESIFQFAEPLAGEIFRIGDAASIAVAGELGALMSTDGSTNTVTIDAFYYPTNANQQARVLVDDAPATIAASNEATGNAAYRFSLESPIDISYLESGEIELVAYLNKVGDRWDQETHRVVTVDDNRFFIDLTQPRVFGVDALDTAERIERFAGGLAPDRDGMVLDDTATFHLDETDLLAAAETAFSDLAVEEFVEASNGDVYALVNETGTMRISRLPFGSEEWETLVQRDDLYGYTIAMSDFGPLVGVSNAFSSSNSGLYLLRDGELVNITIGEPLPYVQFIENHSGYVSVYGNDFSHLYAFNLFSLEEDGARLRAAAVDAISFDNRFFIQDFVLSSDRRTAVIHKTDGTVRFYQNDDGAGFVPASFDSGEVSPYTAYERVVAGEYGTGEYAVYLLLGEDPSDASVATTVMEQRSTGRLLVNSLDLDFLDGGGQDDELLVGATFVDERFSFVGFDGTEGDHGAYRVRSGEILFNTFYPAGDTLEYRAVADAVVLDGGDFSMLEADGLIALGFGSGEDGVVALRKQYPVEGHYTFEYVNPDIEGVAGFYFEVPSSWIESEALRFGFAALPVGGGSATFDIDAIAMSAFLDLEEQDAFSVEHYFDAAIGRYVVTVEFTALAIDHRIAFDIHAQPVGSASPELVNLQVNKKIPVRLPRSGAATVDLPVRGYVYDPTVTELFVEEYRVSVRRDGSFELVLPIASDQDSTRIDLHAYNRLGESTALSFVVELFDSLSALESVRIADAAEPTGVDLVFDGGEATIDQNTVYVSADLFGLVGVIAGYELFSTEYDDGEERRVRIDGGLFDLKDPPVDSHILDDYGVGTGYEAASVVDEEITLYPGTQELVLYAENPGGHRSEYRIDGIDGEVYPTITYTVPEDEQRILITSISAVDLEGAGLDYPAPSDSSIDVEWRLPMTVYESDGASYPFEGTYTVRGRVESIYAIGELRVRSYDTEVTFDEGASETVVAVDSQGRFSFDAHVAMVDRSVTESYHFALIPTAPFLSWIAAGVEIAAEKSFAGACVVPDFSPMHTENWSETELATLRKRLRLDFDRYIPPGARISLVVNYETVISGELQEIAVGGPSYRVVESGEPIDLSGVKFGLNRIAWQIDYDGYLVSSSSLGVDGMADEIFELVGDYEYAATEIDFPISFQRFYDPPEAGGENALPPLRIDKDATTSVEITLNGSSIRSSGVDEAETSIEESFVGYDLSEGRNEITIEVRENTGHVESNTFEFRIDGAVPAIEIGEWTYTEDFDRLRSLSVVVEEANIDDATLYYEAAVEGGVLVSGNQLGQAAEYRYLGNDRYEVRWDSIDEYVYPLRPSEAEPVVVVVRDKADKETLSVEFVGLGTDVDPPPVAEGIAIQTSGTHFAYGVTFENEDGAVPFETTRRAKFYNDHAAYTDLVVDGARVERPTDAPQTYNEDAAYQIERPGSVYLGSDADGGAGVRVESGELSIRAGGTVTFGPGFAVDTGATLSVEAGLAGVTPASSTVEYERPNETAAFSLGFYFRLEQMPEFAPYYDVPRRIVTLYDDGSGGGVYLGYRVATGASRNEAELVLVEQTGASYEVLAVVPDFLLDYDGVSTIGEWDFVLLTADAESETIRVSVSGEPPVATPDPVSAVDTIVSIGNRYYFGDRDTSLNGEFSIANPFTADSAIMPEDVALLTFTDGEDASYTEYYDGFMNRYYAFDDITTAVGAEFAQLRVFIDGDTYDDPAALVSLAVDTDNTHREPRENSRYGEENGGSLRATARQINYVVEESGGGLALRGAPNTVAYNLTMDGTGSSFTLTPSHSGVTGRYFFSNSLDNHGLRNSRWYSVFGSVSDEYEVESGDAAIVLRINGREVRYDLTNGPFHLVFDNAMEEAPDSVVLYVETSVPITFEKHRFMFTEGDYALPPEAFDSFVPVSASTQYAFEMTGTIDFWYKPFATGLDRFARYPATIFDSEYVTIETVADDAADDTTAMVYRARLHGGFEVAMPTNVLVRAGWHHLQISYDVGNNTAFFYVDGEVASFTMGAADGLPDSPSMGGTLPTGDNVWIGSNGAHTTFADGYIDGVRLSNLYSPARYIPNAPVAFVYREDASSPGSPESTLSVVGTLGGASHDEITYQLTGRTSGRYLFAEPSSLDDPSVVFEEEWEDLASGAYTFEGAMEVNGYRFDERIDFIRDIRPQFVVKGTTPLVIRNQASRVDFEVGFDDSYLTESEEGRYAGMAIRIVGTSASGDDFDRTIYAVQDWAQSDPSAWVTIEPALSGDVYPLSAEGSELVVSFADIVTDQDITWEARSFYLTDFFDETIYDFAALLPEYSGEVPIASFAYEIVRTTGESGEEYKLNIVVGNGSGDVDPSIAESLELAYHVSATDGAAVNTGSVAPIPGYSFDIYYEDILPDFGVYDVILSLVYDGESYDSQQLTATWNDTVQAVDEVIVDRRLNVTDFSLLSLTKNDAEAIAKVYLEYDASGVTDLRYDLSVFAVEVDGDYRELTDISFSEVALNPGGRYVIVDGLTVPEGRAIARAVVYDLVDDQTGERELEREVELEIVNSTLAPEVVFTNSVESFITYSNVMFSWRGYHDGEYKPDISYSYNVDGSGWTVATPDARSIELYGLEEGYHTFQVRAYYRGEASATRSVTYFIDLNRPAFDIDLLHIVEQRDGDGFLESVRVSGEAGAILDASLKALYVDGSRVAVSEDGRFDAVEIPITVDGANAIALAAYDVVGNVTDFTLTVDNTLTTVFGPPLVSGERSVRFAPAVLVGSIDEAINAVLDIYLADPTVYRGSEADESRFSGWKRATINEDRTFFVEDVYIHPGASTRSATTELTLAVVTESGRVYTRDISVDANELTLPIELAFSTRAVQGEAVETTIEIDAVAQVDNISSWSIDFDGDGVYDEVSMVDDPATGRSAHWTHAYSSLGMVHPRVRVITRDGLYFSVADQLVVHEAIAAASNIGVVDPIAMDALRMPDGSQRVFVLAGGDNRYRIEVYEVGRNETYVSAKLFQVDLAGMGIVNPETLLAVDEDHLYVADNAPTSSELVLLERNEFGNFEPTGVPTVLYDAVASIALGDGELIMTFENSAQIARIALDEGVTSGEVSYAVAEVPTGAAIGADSAIAIDFLGSLIADRYNQRVVRLTSDLRARAFYGRFGSGEGEFLLPTTIAAYEDRVFVYDATRRDVQVFDLDFDPVTTLCDGTEAGGYLTDDFLDDLTGMDIVAREDGGRLYYYALLLSRSTEQLAMIRLPQWEELRARVRNNTLVFSRDREIYAAKPSGADLRRLVSSDSIPRTEGEVDYPALSPDGHTLVFTSRANLYDGSGESPTGSQYAFDNLYVMGADGEGLRRIPLGELEGYEIERPVFDSNGDRIAFSAKPTGGRWQIYVYALDTGGIERLVDTDENVRFPYFSPDDRFLVFTTDYDGDEEIEIIDVENPTIRVSVTANNVRDSFPVWNRVYPYEISNPDSDIDSKIAFVSERGGRKRVHYLYIARPSDGDVRVVTPEGDEIGGDPDSAALVLDTEGVESDYPSFSGDGASLVYEYHEDWEQQLYRYDYDGEESVAMAIPGGAVRPAGMKNMIVNFHATPVDGDDLALEWRSYTDDDIFYTVEFAPDRPGESTTHKKVFTTSGTRLSDLEMGTAYLVRVFIEENGEESATSRWISVSIPEVEALPTVVVDEENPYLVHMEAWLPDEEETDWNFTWIVDNQEFDVGTSTTFLYEFATSGPKTVQLRAANLSNTEVDLSSPVTVEIDSNIVPVIEYVLAADSSYVELSAEASLGTKIDWSSVSWVVSGPGQTPLTPVTGSRVIIPLDIFEHKVNVNMSLSRQVVTGQSSTDRLETNLTIDLDFKDVMPVITYTTSEDAPRFFTFSGANSIGNIDWYNATWQVFADGSLIGQQSGGSSFPFAFPETGNETTYVTALTIPRISDGQSETTSIVVSIEAVPVEPVIDYEVMTIEVDGNVTGTKLLLSAASSRGDNLDFANAVWSVPVAGSYGESPTQRGPTAIYNLMNITDRAQVEVALTLSRVGGEDPVTVTRFIGLDADEVPPTRVVVNAVSDATTDGQAITFDILDSTGPNIDWEKTSWLFDGSYAHTGAVARVDVATLGVEQRLPYTVSVYLYSGEVLVERGEYPVEAGTLDPHVTVSRIAGTDDNVFELSVTETQGLNIDWDSTHWYIFDGNEDVIEARGATIMHAFAHSADQMGYPVMVEMYYTGGSTPFVGYTTVDVDADELLPVIEWDVPADAPNGTVVTFTAQSSMGSNIDWAQTRWTFGDSSESQYGPVVAHQYPLDGSTHSYTVTLTLSRTLTNGETETATTSKAIRIASEEITPVLRAELHDDGYLVLSAEESEGRGLMLDRTSWLFEGEGDSESYSESTQDGVIVNESSTIGSSESETESHSDTIGVGLSTTISPTKTFSITAQADYSHSSSGSETDTSSQSTSVSTTSYEDYVNTNESFSTSNSHTGAVARRYVPDGTSYVQVTMFVYRVKADGTLEGESITVNVSVDRASQRGGVRYE